MTTYSHSQSVHPTLTTTTVDEVTISSEWERVRVTNRSETDIPLWVRGGKGTVVGVITAAGSGAVYVPAGSWVDIDWPGSGVVQVIGNGNAYSVEGVTDLT